MIRYWESVPHTSPQSARLLDVTGGRLLVRRTAKGRREFAGFINGHRVGAWPTIDEAMQATEKALNASSIRNYPVQR